MLQQDHIKKLISNHTRRLQILEEQQALQGALVDARIIIEIEDIEKKLEELRRELKDLESSLELTPQVNARVATLFDALSEIKNITSSFSIKVWTEISTANITRDISLVPQVSTTNYFLGDEITFNFNATRNCYLTLLNVGTSGKLTILYPNAYVQENFIYAGHIYSFPDKDHPFTYKLTGPPGFEKIKAVATLKYVKLVETDFSRLGDLIFHRINFQQATRDIEIVAKQLSAISVEEWAEDSCTFEVKDNKIT